MGRYDSHPLPVDEWLHGLTNVRPKIDSYNTVRMLIEIFGQPKTDLIVIQLPHLAEDRWLALPTPIAVIVMSTLLWPSLAIDSAGGDVQLPIYGATFHSCLELTRAKRPSSGNFPPDQLRCFLRQTHTGSN